MSRKEVVIQFFRDNWKFWFSVCLAVAFFAIAVTSLYTQSRKTRYRAADCEI